MNTVALLLCLVASAMAVPIFEPVQPFSRSLIVGGTEAAEGEFPFQVSIQKDGILGRYNHCGASVLSENTILTAAHCVENQVASAFTVVVGELNLGVVSGNEQKVAVSELVYHEDYSSSGYINDVGVMHLSNPITLNEFVQPTVLPASGTATEAGTTCTVIGWGYLSEGGVAPDALYKVDVPVVSDEDCNKSYDGGILDSMICAGYPLGGKDSCQGDSGGPFLCGGEQIGIVSWGYGCARPGYPGVYTEVPYFVDWINANTK